METEEKDTKAEEEDPRPLTDEEFEEFKKKDNRQVGIFKAIVDFFTSFF